MTLNFSSIQAVLSAGTNFCALSSMVPKVADMCLVPVVPVSWGNFYYLHSCRTLPKVLVLLVLLVLTL